jgi:hypothetical protein
MRFYEVDCLVRLLECPSLSNSFSLTFPLASSPFLPGQFDENAPNYYLSIRLVQGFSTLASELKLDPSLKIYHVFPPPFLLRHFWTN